MSMFPSEPRECGPDVEGPDPNDYDDWEREQQDFVMLGDAPATPIEAMREFARNAGADRPEQAWILGDFDYWVQNPHYVGPPVPHPESYESGDCELEPDGERHWNLNEEEIPF